MGDIIKDALIKEIGALIIAIGLIVLLACGFDGEVKALLGAVVGYYFARHQQRV